VNHLAEIIASARNPFGIAALVICALLLAFKTQRAPALLFSLFQSKLTRDQFARLLSRAMTFGFIAFVLLCVLTAAAMVLGQPTEPDANAAPDFNVDIEGVTASSEGIRVALAIENGSERAATILVHSVRFWRTQPTRDSPRTNTGDLLVAEAFVVDCPVGVCEQEDTQAKARVRSMGNRSIYLPPERTQVETLGPYPLPPEVAEQGFWLDGLTWVAETEIMDAVCVVAGPPAFPGASPRMCLAEDAEDPDCATKKQCFSDDIPPQRWVCPAPPPADTVACRRA
jgi:hypothetical protein